MTPFFLIFPSIKPRSEKSTDLGNVVLTMQVSVTRSDDMCNRKLEEK